jgi:uncharacterized protein DUF5670
MEPSFPPGGGLAEGGAPLAKSRMASCVTNESQQCQLEAEKAEKETPMFFSWFLILFIVLVVAWVLGWFAFHVAGGLIHILLVVAVISVIVHFARGRP